METKPTGKLFYYDTASQLQHSYIYFHPTTLAMKFFNVTWNLCLSLGVYFMALGGILINTSPGTSIQVSQILLGFYGLTSNMLLLLDLIISGAPEHFLGHSKSAKIYIDVLWVASTVGNAVIFSVMLKNNKMISMFFQRQRTIVDLLSERDLDLKKSRLFTCAKSFFFVMVPLCCFLGLIMSASNHFDQWLNENIFTAVTKILIFIIYIPAYVQVWNSTYNLVMGLMLELAVVERVVSDIFTKTAENEPPFMHLYGPKIIYNGNSSFVKEFSYKTALYMFQHIRNLRLLSNQLFYFPVSWNIFFVSFWLPVSITDFLYHKQQSEILHKLSSLGWVVVLTIYILIGTAPFFLKQLIEYRIESMLQKIKKEYFNSEDPQKKKALIKMSASAKNRFPESPCVFFGLDFDLWPILLNTSVLMITTFLVQ